MLTDGESIPFNLGELRGPLVSGRVTLHFVHLWDHEERVYDARRRPGELPAEPDEPSVLDRVAREVGGGVITEQEVDPALTPPRRGSGRVHRGAGSRAPGRLRWRRTPLLRLCHRSVSSCSAATSSASRRLLLRVAR